MALPLLVVGDAPQSPTGLSRIARDVTTLLHRNQEKLGIEVSQLAMNWDGSPWPWRVFPVFDTENWGREDLQRTWHFLGWPENGVVFTIWDPSRAYAQLDLNLPAGVKRWGYFAVDSVNSNGTLGGPAAEAVKSFDRVLAYGRWGSQVLRKLREESVPYLPHGLHLDAWQPLPQVRDLVGCVATNHARKDLGLLFQVFKSLAGRDETLTFWLHTERFITEAWSIPELAEQCGLNGDRLILTRGDEKDLHVTRMYDGQLAQLYGRCLCTIAPGLGEGFGYPIAESLACGTPVVHGDYAGGAEIVPTPRWRIPPTCWRLDGSYAMARPVYAPERFAHAAWDAIQWMRREEAVASGYCRGAVAHLDWKALAPRWISWAKRGVEEAQ